MEKDQLIINSDEKKDVPIEELLGSVTTYNCSEGSESKSQQVRTSARVFKKLKLDSAVAAAVSPKDSVVKEEKPEAVKKPLRPLWSPEDKSLFFEALNYYGKDFEAIYLHISNKLKKKGIPESVLKTKDQIRHFYYRTWHKISKHLKFSDGVKKIAQELYGLINYGELRRKVGSVSEKIRMKLNELMYRGSVAIRCRGKTVRVKTPLCRALRRLNQLDEKQEEPKLPTRILVEVTPKDVNTWLQVQSMAQNPRIKALLPLQKRLSSLLEYLTARWKTTIALAYNKTLDATISITNDSLNEQTIEENKNLLNPPLRLFPPPVSDFHMPAINLGEYLTSHSVCLSAYEERLGIRPSEDQPWSIKGNLKNKNSKRCRNESINEKGNSSKATCSTGSESNDINANETCLLKNVREVIDEAIYTMLSLQNPNGDHQKDEINNGANEEAKTEIKEDDKCENKGDVKSFDDSSQNEKKNLLNSRLGWTLENCGTLTIGELYLMFGSDSKLPLEYAWDFKVNKEPETIKNGNCSEVSDDNLCHLNDECCQNSSSDSSRKTCQEVSYTLQKLLSVAKLHSGKGACRCSFGHLCGNSSSDKIMLPKNKNLLGKHIKTSSNGEIEGSLNPDCPPKPGENADAVNIQGQIQPVFKQPRSYGIESLMNTHLDHLRPKYCIRKGRRPRTNKLVVERKLPLLANNSGVHQIVQMNIIPQEGNVKMTHGKSSTVTSEPDTNNEVVLDVNSSIASEVVSSQISDNATTSSRANSPSSISALLEFPMLNSDGKDDRMATCQNSSSIPSFAGLLPNSTPPPSPSLILKENDNQWISAEVADFSLSSFLGHLESPAKPDGILPTPSVAEDSRMSQDVDSHLQSLFLESSVDYMAQFADLAAQVTSDKR